MRNTILMIIMIVLGTAKTSAQFYTITKETGINPVPMKDMTIRPDNKVQTGADTIKDIAKDTQIVQPRKSNYNTPVARNSDKSTSLKLGSQNNARKTSSLPTLTIPNLYEEIIRNGIQYPKIVLAQAILETGWFRSPLCKNKHNLFGLTNPRTGKYYEFEHWTESVRAYYTKVQYKYKGGNYLLWLRDIGYAEDPKYIRSVIGVLKQL